jgi:excisionase family DNA binding protein
MTHEFLRTKEAAELLRLSPRTLEGLRTRGGSPRYRQHGKVVVYRRDELEAWSDSRARCSTSERPEAA